MAMPLAGIVSLSVMLTLFSRGDPPLLDHREITVADTSSRDSVRCLDTLRTSDSITAVVKMSVMPQDAKTSLPADFEGLFAQEFRARLKTPSNLRLSVMRGSAPCDTLSILKGCAAGVMVLGATAYATANRDGTLSQIGVVDLALTPEFSDSVRSVLLRMSTDHLVPSFSTPNSIPLEIRIETEEHPDTVARERQLFRATIPRFRSQFRDADWSRKTEPPKYPVGAERARIEDTLVMEFTILPDGRVAPESVDLRSGHYRDFVRSVLTSLANSIYDPASIGGCRVATWVSRKFMFVAP
jgi:Gram-negative bacterial TonB protein C-terminal